MINQDKKTKQINICLTSQDFKTLENRARKEERTTTDTARKLLLKALKTK